MKSSGNHKSVAAVIAQTTKDNESPILYSDLFFNHRTGGQTGVFHKEFFLNAEYFTSGAIQFPHLVNPADFHGRPPSERVWFRISDHSVKELKGSIPNRSGAVKIDILCLRIISITIAL